MLPEMIEQFHADMIHLATVGAVAEYDRLYTGNSDFETVTGSTGTYSAADWEASTSFLPKP